MSENKHVNLDDLKAVNGGASFEGNMAKVFAVNGSEFGFYHDANENTKPYVMIPSGTEMPVDPAMEPEETWLEGTPMATKKEACYWGIYNNTVSVIKAKEVRIEWL